MKIASLFSEFLFKLSIGVISYGYYNALKVFNKNTFDYSTKLGQYKNKPKFVELDILRSCSGRKYAEQGLSITSPLGGECLVHSVSQTVDDIAGTIEEAVVTVLRKMGSGNHAKRQVIDIPKARDFDDLVRKVALSVTRQVQHQVEVSKAKLKQRIRELLTTWHENRVLVLRNGSWRFYAPRLREISQKTGEEKKSSPDAPPPYVNDRRRQRAATV